MVIGWGEAMGGRLNLAAQCLGALLLAAGLAAPARAAEAPALTVGITQYPSTFNPLIDVTSAKSFILNMALRPITTYDAQWKLVCLLCTELPTIENGLAAVETLPDGRRGLAVTIKLKPHLFWGDGTPVTARDVAFTWEVGRHAQTGAADIEIFRRIARIEVKDEHTVVLHQDRVAYNYNDLGDFTVMPAAVEAKAFADPAEYRKRTAYDTDPANAALYNGPYRIVRAVPGSHVELAPNPVWRGPAPGFGRIVVRTIENASALEATLRSGGIDYIPGELGLTLDQGVALERRLPPGYEILYKPGLNYEHVVLDLDNPILKDARVRRALVLGIDRATLVKQLFAGRQAVADGFLPPIDPMAATDLPRYAYDPAEAARLLDEAGWRKDADGVRRNAAGQIFSLSFVTTAGNRSRELVQQALQSQWRALGLDIRLKTEPARVLFGETLPQRKFGGMAMFAWVGAPEASPRTMLRSSEIPGPANNLGGENYAGFRDAEADRLIDALEAELDPTKRKDLWHRLQALYAAALPAIPLYFQTDPYILPRWLKGVEPTGTLYPSTLWVERWRRVP
jgi:peptide/nickel transport system substrate-binding protein